MPIEQELLQLLRCPKCKGPLIAEDNETGYICNTCRLRFLVVNGIPNFLLTDAQPLES